METSENTNTNTLITQVRKGMLVYDNSGKKLGDVYYVYYGDANQDPASDPAVRVSMPEWDADTLLGIVAQIDAPESGVVAEEARARLRREGFFRIGDGVSGTSYAVMTNQIEAVDNTKVRLEVSLGELLKFE
jgi:hypothetical protein